VNVPYGCTEAYGPLSYFFLKKTHLLQCWQIRC